MLFTVQDQQALLKFEMNRIHDESEDDLNLRMTPASGGFTNAKITQVNSQFGTTN